MKKETTALLLSPLRLENRPLSLNQHHTRMYCRMLCPYLWNWTWLFRTLKHANINFVVVWQLEMCVHTMWPSLTQTDFMLPRNVAGGNKSWINNKDNKAFSGRQILLHLMFLDECSRKWTLDFQVIYCLLWVRQWRVLMFWHCFRTWCEWEIYRKYCACRLAPGHRH